MVVVVWKTSPSTTTPAGHCPHRRRCRGLGSVLTMAQPNFALTEEFSWEDFCRDSLASADSWSELTGDARSILTATNLSAVYPFCKTGDWGPTDGAPEMGPMLVHDYHDGILDAAITLWKQATPTVLAMAELWLRLFAGAIAPVGIVFLLTDVLNMNTPNKDDQPSRETGSSLSSRSILVRSMVVILSVSSSVVLATDTLYVFEFGASYGLLLLMVSSGLSLVVCLKRGLRKTIGAVVGLWLLTLYLSWDSSTGQFLFGGDNLPRTFEEGLYHSTTNDYVKKIASNWPVENRTYSFVNGATPWFPTGDSRTGLPFLLNFWDDLTLHEAWVPTVDGEFVRLEFSFPNGGHDRTTPLYLILHGLNGGSQEQFVKDFTHRANANGSTVAIMVARGLMETPVRGWNLFNGARTVDVDSTAKVLRKALGPDQSLIAAGYSMGAIILSNYVARAGKDCPLHGAITVSGGLDMRPQQFFHRARRLWQPFLTITLREQFVVGKMGERYRTRIPRKEMLKLMRATDVTVRLYWHHAEDDSTKTRDCLVKDG